MPKNRKHLQAVSKDGTVKQTPFDIEKYLMLDVYTHGGSGTVRSTGMAKFNRPELVMSVPEGIYFAAACRLMNDVARYIVEKDLEVRDGIRIQVQPWTTVELKVVQGSDGNPATELVSATLDYAV